MNSLGLTLILGELCLILLVLAVFLGWSLRRRTRLQQQWLTALLESVQEHKELRHQAIGDYLHHNLGILDVGLVEALLGAERRYFKTLAKALRQPDPLGWQAVEESLYLLVGQYHALQPESQASSAPKPAVAPASPAPAADTGLLRTENERLSHELHRSLRTLNRIFAEYSAMFGEQVAGGDLSVEEILERFNRMGRTSPAVAEAEKPASRPAKAAPVMDTGFNDTGYVDTDMVDTSLDDMDIKGRLDEDSGLDDANFADSGLPDLNDVGLSGAEQEERLEALLEETPNEVDTDSGTSLSDDEIDALLNDTLMDESPGHKQDDFDIDDLADLLEDANPDRKKK